MGWRESVDKSATVNWAAMTVQLKVEGSGAERGRLPGLWLHGVPLEMQENETGKTETHGSCWTKSTSSGMHWVRRCWS